MKKIFILLFMFVSLTLYAQTPFHKGVNLTNWFQAANPQQIQFTKYRKADFENIQSLGCDVIRLPINLHAMTDGDPAYNLDTIFLSFLDQAVDWAEELNIHLILDNHSFDPSSSTDPNIGEVLIPVWQNMARHFKDRSNLIYYEVLNEPHGIASHTWNSIQLATVDAIREVDSVHTIIVGPSNWNSYNYLDDMPVYPDTNLIYTFHFYDPFLFTHQGASWTTPSMVPLANVPFPYDQTKMPTFPSELVGTWVESAFNNYHNDGTVTKIKQLINIADNFQKARNVPIFCGEFGVYMLNSDNADRVEWYRVVREYFEEKGIPWTTWDYQGGFGLFEKGSGELFDYDLNMDLIRALGLNEVDQKDSTNSPETDPFSIYTDQIESGITESSWSPNATLNFHSAYEPSEGSYCIHWANAKRYNTIGFDFQPDKDLSYFADIASGIFFNMMIKGDTPNTKLDIRFVDSKTDDPEDHPWRMGYTIELSDNNIWEFIEIPLSAFEERGSWDNNSWYDPIGEYDWSKTDRFEIVAEYQDLSGINFWFDDIKFRWIDVSADYEPEQITFSLNQNFPNPFNPTTKITFSIPTTAFTTLKIFNVLGEEITTLVNKELYAGMYQYSFDGRNLSSGIYIYELHSNFYRDIKKMLLIK